MMKEWEYHQAIKSRNSIAISLPILCLSVTGIHILFTHQKAVFLHFPMHSRNSGKQTTIHFR